jgi:hypothetical protein
MATGYTYKDEVDTRIVTWADLNAGETGDAYAPKGAQGVASSVQVSGLSDSTLTMQESNDDENYFTLPDVFGASVAMTVDDIAGLATASRYIRPKLTGGTDTGVVVTLVLRG